jgi:murein L,D-transpeptidase YafK
MKKAMPVIPVVKNCPLNLSGLRKYQAVGYFLNCDPTKDGTAFIEEQPDIAMPTDPYSIWLLIDTAKQQLEVKQGDQTLAVFENIAIGRSGAGLKKHRGDDVTPQGEYKIGWINPQSPFHIFYGLTYPSVEDAKQALSQGSISELEYSDIVYAHEHNQTPPQNTALGGQVGLHGLGKGDEEIHQTMNWTHGCVALTNNQINELDRWIVQGMRVKIK